MKIGLDYHGVIANATPQKQEQALETFGVTIPAELCSRSSIIDNGLLTEPQYEQLLRDIYRSKRSLEAPPQGDSIEAIGSLLVRHEVQIVTGSDDEEMSLIEQWLAEHDLGHAPLTTVGYRGNKAIDNFDVFVDDKPAVLEVIRPIVPRRYLFNQPYNQAIALPDTGIQRISSLFELEEPIQ